MEFKCILWGLAKHSPNHSPTFYLECSQLWAHQLFTKCRPALKNIQSSFYPSDLQSPDDNWTNWTKTKTDDDRWSIFGGDTHGSIDCLYKRFDSWMCTLRLSVVVVTNRVIDGFVDSLQILAISSGQWAVKYQECGEWHKENKKIKNMAPERFELSTFGLQDRRSNPWAMEPVGTNPWVTEHQVPGGEHNWGSPKPSATAVLHSLCESDEHF